MKTDSRNEVVRFLAFAFGIPLLCVFGMTYIKICSSGFLYLVLYGIAAASPTIAAIMVNFQKGRWEGIRQFLVKKYIDNFKLKYAVIAFLIPATLLTLVKLITFSEYGSQGFFTPLSMKKWIIIVWSLIAEELGWRGYLQEKIEDRIGAAFTPLVIGVIWLLWHYHFFIAGNSGAPILLFGVSCIAESYGYYLITKWAGGNVIPASVWHFTGNLFFNVYLLNPNWNQGSTVPYAMVTVLYCSYIVLFTIYRRKVKKI